MVGARLGAGEEQVAGMTSGAAVSGFTTGAGSLGVDTSDSPPFSCSSSSSSSSSSTALRRSS